MGSKDFRYDPGSPGESGRWLRVAVEEMQADARTFTMGSVPALLRRERCPGSGEIKRGTATLCMCGQMIPAPQGAAGEGWTVPEHDGECSW